MTPEEILLKAAEDQIKYGHHKGTYYAEPGDAAAGAAACSYGSMGRVAGQLNDGWLIDVRDSNVSEAAKLLADQIRLAAPILEREDDYTVITKFNDNDNTTGEDVALMMKKAASHG